MAPKYRSDCMLSRRYPTSVVALELGRGSESGGWIGFSRKKFRSRFFHLACEGNGGGASSLITHTMEIEIWYVYIPKVGSRI
jgi:hypothetical protein